MTPIARVLGLYIIVAGNMLNQTLHLILIVVTVLHFDVNQRTEFDIIILQQDGTPAHRACNIVRFLSRQHPLSFSVAAGQHRP